jgi:predicted ABC-type ATPase
VAENGGCSAFSEAGSGKNYNSHVPEWQKEDYTVKLYFLRLPDPEFAIARVKQRVKEGGHNAGTPGRSFKI